MSTKSLAPKRRNKTVQLGDMIGSALDRALKRRGFASRDLVANWGVIAPTPWDKIAMPDKLVWPRRDKAEPEGAVLHLRCMEGHGLALAHEGQAIAAAVNRYFGYLLVGSVRLSLVAYAPDAAKKAPAAKALPTGKVQAIRDVTSRIEDDGLRGALERLGRGVMGREES